MSDMIADMVSRLFRDHRPAPEAAPVLHPAFWAEIEAAGVPLALLPEDLGGFGLTSLDACEILIAAGEQAVPGPLAETMLGNYLLARAGLEPVTGPLVLAPADAGLARAQPGQLLAGVPYGRDAAALLLLGNGWLELHGGPFANTPGQSLAGEPLDTVTLGHAPAARAGLDLPPLVIRGLRAALTVAQMAGAGQAALDLALRHVRDREQFGRPLAAFQAVQHAIAVIASEVAASRAAAAMAAAAIPAAGTDPDGFLAAAAAAKIRAGEAAGKIAALAHQVHGAIGITREYELHLFTRRLWAWRDAHGSETFWAEHLGSRLCALGPEALWPELTRRIGAAA